MPIFFGYFGERYFGELPWEFVEHNPNAVVVAPRERIATPASRARIAIPAARLRISIIGPRARAAVVDSRARIATPT